MSDQAFVIDNGDMNLIQSALGAAAHEAALGHDLGVEPGDYLEAADRLAAQYEPPGHAGQEAQRRLGLLASGARRQEVYHVAYVVSRSRFSGRHA